MYLLPDLFAISVIILGSVHISSGHQSRSSDLTAFQSKIHITINLSIITICGKWISDTDDLGLGQGRELIGSAWEHWLEFSNSRGNGGRAFILSSCLTCESSSKMICIITADDLDLTMGQIR